MVRNFYIFHHLQWRGVESICVVTKIGLGYTINHLFALITSCTTFIVHILYWVYKMSFWVWVVFLKVKRLSYMPTYTMNQLLLIEYCCYVSIVFGLKLIICMKVGQPCWLGCRIHQLNLCRGVRSLYPPNECLKYDIKPSDGESVGKCKVPHHCYYSQVHSDSEW